MSPIQQMLLGAGGAVATKTYVDDIFSSYLWAGNGSGQTITNNINVSGEGALVWIKKRSGGSAQKHILSDTVRGFASAGNAYYLSSNSSEAQDAGALLTAFNNNGFNVSSNDIVNGSGSDYTSWTFRKAPGFFDVVTYTGNGADGRTISHSLGSIPGMIIFKKTSGNFGWYVYHREIGETKFLRLDTTDTEGSSGGLNNTAPTSSTITLGNNAFTNGNNDTYVAYVFAGGESTAATARSVDFDGSGDYLSVADSDDFCFESGAFTLEAWIKPTTITNKAFIAKWVSGQREWFFGTNSNELKFAYSTDGSGYTILDSGYDMQIGQWQHIAVTRDSSSNIRFFVNGIQQGATHSVSATFNNSTQALVIAHNDDDNTWQPNAKISNVRIVKGTAVYTTAFRPPTEPLTNITNTKLLCCNDSSTTGSTVTPGTITANGDPTASTDSPFDDPAGFAFGDAGDQNVISTGSWTGSGTADLEVNVGFEPQWVIFKNASASYNWYVLDVMRGIVSGGDDRILAANTTSAEWDSSYIDVTPTGFKLQTSHPLANGSGNTYIYMCLRRPDGYCGKPVELGTSVLSLTYGSSNTNPSYVTNFPVDFSFSRRPASSEDWYTAARLIQGNYLKLNETDAEASHSAQMFDYSNGWHTQTANLTDYLSWSWKRHAGFEVITYSGLEMTGGRQIPHSMGITPEMMWVFRLNGDDNWAVYHKGLNGGTNPEQYDIHLNLNSAEADNTTWNDTAPTATHFSVSPNSNEVNQDGKDFIAMLFASVSGVSAVGSYTGNGSTTGPIITTGFQPRLIMLKRADDSGSWYLYDTLRGLGSGNDHRIELNESYAQSSGADDVDVLSTGFQLKHTWDNLNGNGGKYIYYCHA